MKKFPLFGLLALCLVLVLSADAFAFGRRCGGCNGGSGRVGVFGRIFQPMRGTCVGGCPQSCGQSIGCYSCPMTGCPSGVTTLYHTGPGTLGTTPQTFRLLPTCPGGVCPPAR